MKTEKYYCVYHKSTGRWVKKNASYGGFRYVDDPTKATRWKTRAHLKNSKTQGVLMGERNLMVSEFTVETVVTRCEHFDLSEI